jgi:hypothetical protein
MMDPHLSEDVIEALAHDRFELAPSGAADHVASCAECRALVEETRALSFSLRDALRENTALDLELDAIVSAAVAAGLEPERQEALASLPPVKAPGRTPLAIAIAAGLAVAALPSVMTRPELPSVGVAVDLLRAFRLVFSALDVAVSAMPGGWGLVMFTGLVALGLLAVPAYRLSGGRHRVPSSVMMSLASVALCFALVPSAHALEFEGELPEQATLTIDLKQVPTSEALRRIAQAAQLGLVVTLPDDPKVTVRVRKAPLKEVLTAVLGDAPVLVKREGSLLIVRPLPTAPSEPTPPTPPTPPGEVPLVQPHVPTPPTPPLPPSLGRKGRNRNDRVTFGGNSVIRAGERVKDVVTLGGNTTIYGIVEGDVVVIGGNTTIKKGAEVFGEIVALGGNVDTEEGATIHQGASHDEDEADEPEDEDEDESADAEADADETDEDGDDSDAGAGHDDEEDGSRHGAAGIKKSDHDGHGGGDHDAGSEEDGWFAESLFAFSRYALLFVLGLVMLLLVPARLAGVTRAITTAPLRAGALGFVSAIGAALLCVLLTITLIGAPAAFALAVAASLTLFAGLAATGFVLGGLLPIKAIRGQPILELVAGMLLLFFVSRLGGFGFFLVSVACLIGSGAIVSTRFAAPPAPPVPPAGETPPTSPVVPGPTTPEVV